MEKINNGETIKGAEKFDDGVSNSFEYQLRDVFEKNKIPVAAVYTHRAFEDYNRIEGLFFGRPPVEWILACWELLNAEMERRKKEGGILSSAEEAPEADPDEVKRLKKMGIDPI